MRHDNNYSKERSGRGIKLWQAISTIHHPTDWIQTSSIPHFFTLNLREHMFLRHQTTLHLFYKKKAVSGIWKKKGPHRSS